MKICYFKPTSALSKFLLKIVMRLEQFRVKNHLSVVEKELRRRNVDHLAPELQQERAKNINHLHDYWTKGLFPKNLDFAGKRVPYFKDAFGTPCAMAYLIEQSANQNLVNTVAESNNYVYINDIHDGPVLD